MTGPMYIISEARMKTERVRERNTGKRWREEAEWEQTTSRGQIYDTEHYEDRRKQKKKQTNTRIGKSVAFPRAL